MTPRTYHILKKLGINPDKNKDEVFLDLLNIADFLFDELERDEKERFRREIRRLISKPSS